MSAADEKPLCPSADPGMDGAVVFGVVGGTAAEPRLGYLKRVLAVTPGVLRLAQPAEPAEVFRFAAPCAESACRHFDGARCQLAARIVDNVDPVETSLPPCRIRPWCRWWREEGRAACLRCPAIVRDTRNPTAALATAAGPSATAPTPARHPRV